MCTLRPELEPVGKSQVHPGERTLSVSCVAPVSPALEPFSMGRDLNSCGFRVRGVAVPPSRLRQLCVLPLGRAVLSTCCVGPALPLLPLTAVVRVPLV